jgi:uncharacterized protein
VKKIDIHCHTTNRKLKDMLVEDASLDELMGKMYEHNVEKTVVLATYFPHKQSGVSNFRLANWIDNNPKFVMFGSLDFEHYFYQGYNELEEMADKKMMKGIKIYTGYQEIDLKSDKFSKVVDLARKYDLPMMFHCGYSYASMRKYGKMAITTVLSPGEIAPIAKKNEDVNFILSHLGKPSFDNTREVITKNSNVYTDMSGIIDSKYHAHEIPMCVEQIKQMLYEAGPKKLLFGTDFPVQTHEHSIRFIEESMKEFSLEDKHEVYYGNAKRLLRI